jgi:hypothetical protein
MRFLALLLSLSVLLSSEESRMPAPKYTNAGRLIRPEGYREWMFVGASLGMGYTEGNAPSRSTYHSIYIQREAYQHYAKTGTFPNQTMLVMEVLSPGTNVSINKNGSFSDKSIGIEVALKDESKFPDKWAYFNFIGEGDKPLADAGAFRKDACWSCHNKHAAVDNVFVQFYPALRDLKKK